MVESFLCESWIMTTSSYFLKYPSPSPPPRDPGLMRRRRGGVTPPADAAARPCRGNPFWELCFLKVLYVRVFPRKRFFSKTIPFVLPKIKVLLPKWPYGTWDHFMVSSTKRFGHCILQSKLICWGTPLSKLLYGWVISLWIMNNDYFFLFLLISWNIPPSQTQTHRHTVSAK